MKNQFQTTNSYTSITLSSAPSKTGCAKCDAKKLPICVCSKSNAEENKSEEKTSVPTENAKNIDSIQQPNNFYPKFCSQKSKNMLNFR